MLKSRVTPKNFFLGVYTALELYKRNTRKSVSWQTFLEASEALLIGSRDERVGQKLGPITSDTGPGVYIFSEDSESSTTSQQFPLTLVVMPRRRGRALTQPIFLTPGTTTDRGRRAVRLHCILSYSSSAVSAC